MTAAVPPGSGNDAGQAPTVYVAMPDGAYLWLTCFADDPDGDGEPIHALDAGDKWDDLVAKVREHQAEHGCGGAR